MTGSIKCAKILAFCLLYTAIYEVRGDDTTTTTSMPEIALNCSSIKPNDNLDYTQLNGTWFELYRKEFAGAKQSRQCVKLVLTPRNPGMILEATYSNSSSLTKNTTFIEYVKMDSNNPGMFNVYYNASWPNITMKLINSDYTNYMLACGYNNASDEAGAYFFYRKSKLSSEDANLINEVSEEYSDFNNMSSVIQGSSCYSGSSAIIPLFTIILTLVFTTLKILN